MDINLTDMNLVVLAGRVAAPPELRVFDGGTRLLRMLVATRSHRPRRRLDVIPVTWWDPDSCVVDSPPEPGDRVVVIGGVQRRFWEAAAGRRSRLEVVARHVELPRDEPVPLLAN